MFGSVRVKDVMRVTENNVVWPRQLSGRIKSSDLAGTSSNSKARL